MKYYSALERNGILTQATVWMNLENIMLSEINQTQILYDSTYDVPRVVKFIETERGQQEGRNGESFILEQCRSSGGR